MTPKLKAITVRLDPEILEGLRVIARRNDRSVTAEVTRAVRQYVYYRTQRKRKAQDSMGPPPPHVQEPEAEPVAAEEAWFPSQ
jgi:hypothetical protein